MYRFMELPVLGCQAMKDIVKILINNSSASFLILDNFGSHLLSQEYLRKINTNFTKAFLHDIQNFSVLHSSSFRFKYILFQKYLL